jgi:capsid protein
MSTYLDQLIKTVEVEAEEQTHLKEQERIRRFPSKRAGSGLKRALQRLEVLKSLRKAERRAPISH